jgi:hypothetical protein
MEKDSTHTPMVISTKESFKKDSRKVVESMFIDLEPPMRVIGTMIKKVALELIFTPIKKYTQEDGLMEKNMDMESMSTKMETNTMESG